MILQKLSSSHAVVISLIVAQVAIATTTCYSSPNCSQSGVRDTRAADRVYLYPTRLDFYISPSNLTLECDTKSDDVRFYRESDGSTPEEITFPRDPTSPVVKSITFPVTSEREGRYYCTGGGVRSEPSSLEIVAYPIPNSSLPKRYEALLSTDVTIPCVFSPGLLHDRYTLVWFKGVVAIDTTDPRFDITPDFALVIERVNALDASGAYYCEVHVESRERLLPGYHSLGPSVELVVTDPPIITHPPQDTVHLPSTPTTPQSAIFTCTATGLPPPSLTWLHNGERVTASKSSDIHGIYTTPSNTTVDVSGATVVSNLYITAIEESDSGLVECIAIQHGVGEDDMIIISSSARFTVLPSSFTPNLLPTSNGVELTTSLPSLLPTSFSLAIFFYDINDDLISKSELFDVTFANSDSIDYIITEDRLPSLETFAIRVRVKVGDLEGELSQPSNVITIQKSGSGPKSEGQCSCSGDQTGMDTTADDTNKVQTILVIFIVLLIVLLTIAVGVALWGVVMMIRRMKRADSKGSLDDRSSRYSDKSRSRSRSRSPYHSRSRSRSPYSSRSRSRFRSSSRSRSRSPSRDSCSRTISIGRSYRSESEPRDYTEHYRALGGGAVVGGVSGGGREDPEGGSEYVQLERSPTDVRSGAGPTVSGHANSVIVRPLPSEPFKQHPVPQSNPQDKENEYEEVTFKNTKKKIREGEREGREGEGEGERGRGKEAREREGEEMERGGREREEEEMEMERGGRVRGGGKLKGGVREREVVSVHNPLTLESGLEEASVV